MYDLQGLTKTTGALDPMAQSRELAKIVGNIFPQNLPADVEFEIRGSTLFLFAPEDLQAAVSTALSQRAVNF